jgi:hypothetical protein
MVLCAYSYQNAPWLQKSGDDVRIYSILRNLAIFTKVYAVGISLDNNVSGLLADNVIYRILTRPFYKIFSKIIGWRHHYDLNPLSKLTLYLDEINVAIQIRQLQCPSIYVFGSMSLLPLYLRLFGFRGKIIYDPLANYAQTLYLQSRKKLSILLKYGIYLLLHKQTLRNADVIIYPSAQDRENALKMFHSELREKQVKVVPNSIPICYESEEEYRKYRAQRRENIPYFIMVAGSKGKTNESAVKLAIETFKKIEKPYRLIITGPWQYLDPHISSIKITGYLPQQKLKELLAQADYGLAPIFTHAAGTFLKTMAYIAAGLDILTTPLGIDLELVRWAKPKIYLIRTPEELRVVALRAIQEYNPTRKRRPILCIEAEKYLTQYIRNLV